MVSLRKTPISVNSNKGVNWNLQGLLEKSLELEYAELAESVEQRKMARRHGIRIGVELELV